MYKLGSTRVTGEVSVFPGQNVNQAVLGKHGSKMKQLFITRFLFSQAGGPGVKVDSLMIMCDLASYSSLRLGLALG